MRLERIIFQPVAYVICSQEHIEIMVDCATAHYDAVCKHSLDPNSGFLWGMRNCEINAPGQPHCLTFRNLDTLAKIVEVGRYLGGEKSKVAFGIGLRLNWILRTLSDVLPAPLFFEQEGQL